MGTVECTLFVNHHPQVGRVLDAMAVLLSKAPNTFNVMGGNGAAWYGEGRARRHTGWGTAPPFWRRRDITPTSGADIWTRWLGFFRRHQTHYLII